MAKKLQWGLIGAGFIAREFADGVLGSETGELLAVAAREPDRAAVFAKEFGIERAYGGYQQLLDDPDVDAVYISTPHPMHAEWAVKAAEAGKHILVEKPVGVNYFEAVAQIDAAREHDVFLMEAFMYRCHPQIARLRELVQSGAIGKVKLVRASFSYRAGFDPNTRQYANDLAGGGILDVGCYPVSMARLIAGTAQGKLFEEPIDVKGAGHLGKTGVDEYAAAVLRFPGDLIAEVSTGIGLNMHDVQIVEIFGSDGKITLPDPWSPSRFNRDPTKIILNRHDEKTVETILVDAPKDLYGYEADEVGSNISKRQADAMSWDDSLGNMRVLDRWRAELGLVYELEKSERGWKLKPDRPLATLPMQSGSVMKCGTLPGLSKKVSRLVFGCDSNHTFTDTAVMLDYFFERGGNTFDTSHGYGNPNGACEKNLGAWIRSRGVRDEVVVMEKGGNPPHVTPEGVDFELRDGLARLGIDQVDIFTVHRDNPAVPIGEWADMLNRHLRAGRMKIFGLSNFRIDRLEAFSAYAKQNNLASYSIVSNQFSLARLHDENLWPGYHAVTSGDDVSRQWFERTQTPLMCWSSQARGFFLPQATPDNRSNPEWTRCWFSPENFERKRRAQELATRLGVDPINVALAYVLCQPFPTFPLVGPKRPAEIRSTLEAMKIELSPDQLVWLRGTP